MAEQEWEVGGFRFGSEKDAELAKTELEKIEYLDKRIQYDHPESVLAIYNKAIENRVFQTPVGLQYLQKLKAYLGERHLDGQAKSIPLYQVYSYDAQAEIRRHTAPRRVQPSQYRQLRSKLRISVLLNIALIILVIAMFAIALTGNNPTILNYERALTDKYAGWEQELTERETTIREKERELNISRE